MLWVATGRAAYLVIGLILFVVGAYAGWLLFDHVQLRVDIWLHALDPAKVFAQGYGQLAQAEFGMASGGIVGTGLGQGSPGLIPFAATDFIFAAIGEELGLLGTTAVLLLVLVLVGKGLRVGLRAPDGFSTLLAVGLSTLVALQAFVIVGGVTRIIPLTGVTLPFVSYGGSSLISNFVLLGLLVRVSSGPLAPRERSARLGLVERVGWMSVDGSADPQARDGPARAVPDRVRADQLHPGVRRRPHRERPRERPTPADRRVQGRPRQHPGGGRHDGPRVQPQEPGRAPVPAALPARRAVRARDRLLLVRVRPERARAELQRLPHRRRRRAPAADAHRPDPRPARSRAPRS